MHWVGIIALKERDMRKIKWQLLYYWGLRVEDSGSSMHVSQPNVDTLPALYNPQEPVRNPSNLAIALRCFDQL